jgi:hypothetical protein
MGMLIPDSKALFSSSWASALVDIIENEEESRFYRTDYNPLKRRQLGTRFMPSYKRVKSDFR